MINVNLTKSCQVYAFKSAGLFTNHKVMCSASFGNAGEQSRIHLGRDTLSRMILEWLREVPLRETWFSWDAR